jgi:lipoyl(octanoyl) transferase
MQKVYFNDLGIKAYKEIWDYQEELLHKNVSIKSTNRDLQPNEITQQTTNHLLFVEHKPVYTLGKNGNENNILISNMEMQQKHIDYYHINRGGDITFHGLGQLVGYPILDLDNFKTDLGWYLRSIEQFIINTIADYGLQGERSKGETGVWLDTELQGKERKICAIGIKCSRWVTMHGFALNVNTDLSYFNNIVPCGIVNKKVTSIEKELGKKVDFEEVKEKLKKNFELVFDAELI